MSFTGTAEELDEQLPDAIVSFVASHLDLKNTLARARKRWTLQLRRRRKKLAIRRRT